MIIEFQPYLERRRNLTSTVDSPGLRPKSSDVKVEEDLFRTPLDDAPEAYREGFKNLWIRVHQAIRSSDCSPIDTERRLGIVSNQALYMIEGWPERLKSFLWKKYGEGFVQHADLAELFSKIDRLAALDVLRPRESV